VKGGRSGAVLFIVLLLILALGAVSSSALVLARWELVAERGGRTYLRQRTEGESLLFERSETVSTERWTRIESDLGAGYRFIEARPQEGLSMFSVAWVLDPEAVVRTLPGALRVWNGTVPEGIGWLSGCPSASTRPLAIGAPAEEGVSPAPEQGPRIGPLGIPELLAVPGGELSESGLLPAVDGPAVLRALGPVRLWGGAAEGLFVAASDLKLEGSAHFRGLLIVGGTLDLAGSASVEGVSLVGGGTTISEDAKMLGCPDLALAPLRLAELSGEHPLPGGSFLGRY
jgi:hypothetical protein